jgi:hypothetical protein
MEKQGPDVVNKFDAAIKKIIMTSIRSDGWPITPHGLSVLCQYKSG